MLGLPAHFKSDTDGGGVLQDTASSSTLCALLAAREKATGFAGNARGLENVDRKLVAYTSSQAHLSLEKGARIAGLGSENTRSVEVDDSFAMRPEALEAAIRADRAAGRTPFFVMATVGTTSSSAIDPLPAIGEICRRHGLWLHVDAAYAGSAAVCPELRFIHAGVENAASYTFNPHKWMLTNFDCNVFWVRDREALIKTFSILPEFLKNQPTESGAVFDYRDWHIPLGRRFRALKLWCVIRHYGVEGLRRYIRGHVQLARELADWIEKADDFELAAPVPLSLVCFRHKGGDEVNQKLMDEINAGGQIYLTHTKLDDKLTLRMAIGSTHTERRHVEKAWQLIRSQAAGTPWGGNEGGDTRSPTLRPSCSGPAGPATPPAADSWRRRSGPGSPCACVRAGARSTARRRRAGRPGGPRSRSRGPRRAP
jgi:aromatic-L-amino-acid decarboxylase